MSARIALAPRPGLAELFGRSSGRAEWPGHPERRWYSLGRGALEAALRGLASPGERVWFPALHCGVEVEAAVRAGLRPAFYDVASGDTSAEADPFEGDQCDTARIRPAPWPAADVDDLARRVEGDPGHVVLSHFFGRPDPGAARIARLCDGLGVALIEDLSHALFAGSGSDGVPPGMHGAIAIASLRKVLGTPDGGWLAFDPGRTVPFDFSPPAPRRRALLPAFAWVLAKAGLPAPGAWTPREEPDPGTPTGSHTVSGTSRLSRRLLRAVTPDAVRSVRRRNWRVLERAFGAETDSASSHRLGSGTSPLVWLAASDHSASVVRALRVRGVDPYVFGARAHPALPQEEFEDTRAASRRWFGLPVHQALSTAEMMRVADALEEVMTEA